MKNKPTFSNIVQGNFAPSPVSSRQPPAAKQMAKPSLADLMNQYEENDYSNINLKLNSETPTLEIEGGARNFYSNYQSANSGFGNTSRRAAGQSPFRGGKENMNDQGYRKKNGGNQISRFADCIKEIGFKNTAHNQGYEPQYEEKPNMFGGRQQTGSRSPLRGQKGPLISQPRVNPPSQEQFVFKANQKNTMNFSELARRFNNEQQEQQKLSSHNTLPGVHQSKFSVSSNSSRPLIQKQQPSHQPEVHTSQHSRSKSRTKLSATPSQAPKITKHFRESDGDDYYNNESDAHSLRESIQQHKQQLVSNNHLRADQYEQLERQMEKIKQDNLRMLAEKKNNSKVLLPKVIEEMKANVAREIEQFARNYLGGQKKEEDNNMNNYVAPEPETQAQNYATAPSQPRLFKPMVVEQAPVETKRGKIIEQAKSQIKEYIELKQKKNNTTVDEKERSGSIQVSPVATAPRASGFNNNMFSFDNQQTPIQIIEPVQQHMMAKQKTNSFSKLVQSQFPAHDNYLAPANQILGKLVQNVEIVASRDLGPKVSVMPVEQTQYQDVNNTIQESIYHQIMSPEADHHEAESIFIHQAEEADRLREQQEREAEQRRLMEEQELIEHQRKLRQQAELEIQEARRQLQEQRIAFEAQKARILREEAEMRQRQEAEARAKYQHELRLRQQAERQARELAERHARELAERHARELAERQARELAERQARELAERQARQYQEAARRRQEAEKLRIEEQRQQELQRQRKQAERLRIEEEKKRLQEQAYRQFQIAQEARVKAQKQQQEHKQRLEQEQRRKQAQLQEAKRLEEQRIEAERREAERREAERREAERREAERREAERREAERLEKLEQERIARLEAQRKAKQEAQLAQRIAREELERKAREQAEREIYEESQRLARLEAERIAREQAERVAAAKKLAEEQQAKEKLQRCKAQEQKQRQRKEEQEKAKLFKKEEDPKKSFDLKLSLGGFGVDMNTFSVFGDSSKNAQQRVDNLFNFTKNSTRQAIESEFDFKLDLDLDLPGLGGEDPNKKKVTFDESSLHVKDRYKYKF